MLLCVNHPNFKELSPSGLLPDLAFKEGLLIVHMSEIRGRVGVVVCLLLSG